VYHSQQEFVKVEEPGLDSSMMQHRRKQIAAEWDDEKYVPLVAKDLPPAWKACTRILVADSDPTQKRNGGLAHAFDRGEDCKKRPPSLYVPERGLSYAGAPPEDNPSRSPLSSTSMAM
jgi:hypothetical protein